MESEEEEKMQRGSSNPLKHFLGPSFPAQSGKGRILRPFSAKKKKRFAISFHTCRQLAAPTGSQLGWKGARKEWRGK